MEEQGSGIGLGGIGMIAGAAEGLFRSGLGIAQLIKARRMRTPQRPTYNIPQPIQNQLGLAQNNLNARMAGAAQAENNIYQNQATAMSNIQQGSTNSATQLGSAAIAQAQTNRSMENLQAQESMDYQRRLQALGQAQNTMAGYQDKQWDINQYEPYMNAMATKSALQQGGLMNLYGGLGDLGGQVAQMGAMDYMQPGIIKSMWQHGGQKRYPMTQAGWGIMNAQVAPFKL